MIGFIPVNLFAQFTYVDMGISYSRMKLVGGGIFEFEEQTTLSIAEFHVGGLWRFKRFVGVGLDLGVPFLQNNNVDFRNAKTSNSYNHFQGLTMESFDSRYQFSTVDYSIKQSLRLGLLARIFFAGRANLFVDLKASGVKMKENFKVTRSGAPEIPGGLYDYNVRPELIPVSINQRNEEMRIVPGVALGLQPHINKKFFLTINFGLDFYNFNNKKDFSHKIAYEYDANAKQENFVIITSPLTYNKRAFSGNVRFGMFF